MTVGQVCGPTKWSLYLHSCLEGVPTHPWFPGEEVPRSWAQRTWRRHCFVSAGNRCCTFLQHQKLTLGVRSKDKEAVARSLELETPVATWTLNALPFWESNPSGSFTLCKDIVKWLLEQMLPLLSVCASLRPGMQASILTACGQLTLAGQREKIRTEGLWVETRTERLLRLIWGKHILFATNQIRVG